ncbi:hypothetical protein [Reichenbachiella ulvae]|uniref:DUF2029 domain-containing protein n=1 Tax=Reichenbachiella ulvae TaxID=2980104 RepID=A0ABT3CX98_9BACT|nr:hypothetical protein [Reichenbachiella ulvae]MCV9388316.1 hypothetical protein [Reichenbachiella ulvae]
MLDQKTVHQQNLYLYSGALLAYAFYYISRIPMDYGSCPLCDAHQYTLVYRFFEEGFFSQIKFPYYNRPLVPWLASLIPDTAIRTHFDIINFGFFLISIVAIRQLWLELKINFLFQVLGFAWLCIHWTGIIRYNLHDNITVDVPVYFFQAFALLAFFQNKLKWLYLITPLALLQKESFLAMHVVLIGLHFFDKRKTEAWKGGKHLLLSLVFAIVIQKGILSLLPEYEDQRSSIGALLYHGRWALEDPTRFARWFAAFGLAYGVLPFIALFLFRLKRLFDFRYQTLVTLSLMYCFFGILAGEDQIRILFLGFPFIMSISLLELQRCPRSISIPAIVLSLVSLRLYPFYIVTAWATDFAPLAYVWKWFAYFVFSTLILFGIYLFQKRKIKGKGT